MESPAVVLNDLEKNVKISLLLHIITFTATFLSVVLNKLKEAEKAFGFVRKVGKTLTKGKM